MRSDDPSHASWVNSRPCSDPFTIPDCLNSSLRYTPDLEPRLAELGLVAAAEADLETEPSTESEPEPAAALPTDSTCEGSADKDGDGPTEIWGLEPFSIPLLGTWPALGAMK